MIEALPVHSQLWLICEYCPGGSVKTLMRATNDRLAEKYLIVVARELGKALKGLHQAGIMHRDVKAANVLIHENGGLQLCDFGVAATLEGSKDKRRTFIGTLHWMPPELWHDKPEYSDEVDVWGYGCTIYECALGRPPNADVRERQQLKMRMRRLKQSISLPDNEDFSHGLRSLVQFALNPDVASRPSMQDILHHDYLTETEQTHPTSSLTELVQHYYGWLFSGGHRASLFMPGGAVAASVDDEDSDMSAEEWNFSMTQDFEKRVSAIFEIPDLSDESWVDDFEGEATPKQPKPTGLTPQKDFSAAQQVNFERRVQRGEGLANLFDQAKPAYEYKTKTDFIPVQTERRISDLPFRAMAEDRPSSIASNVIDLGDFDSDDYAIAAPISSDNHVQTVYTDNSFKEESGFRLADAATIRAKRADSKGPRDPNNLTSRHSFGIDEPNMPNGIEAQDFAMAQDEWTLRDSKPALQEAAEITPTGTNPRAAARQTMEWSFASAMSELTPTTTDESGTESTPSVPRIDVPSDNFNEKLDTKAKKHATLDWSFSDAMAQASTTDEPEFSTIRDTPRRPAPMQRTMTQPITQNEVQYAYDDGIPSRPDTALSFAYSETSQSSTDFDPFALERHGEMDDVVQSDLDEMGASSFYSTRGRTMSGISLNGPGPEDDGMMGENDSVKSSGLYINGRSSRMSRSSQEELSGNTITASNARTSHYRGHATHVSRSSAASASSRGSIGTSNLNPSTPSTAGLAGSHERGPSNTSISSVGTTGTRVSQIGAIAIGFPDPKPPKLTALTGDADAETVERELERLLGEFQGALGIAGDMLSEELRGRGRTRRDRTVNGFGPVIGESEGEWEDDGEHED